MLNLQERSPETIQNPGADTKILFNDSTDGLLKTKDSSGVVETLATTEGIADTEPKVYVALLTQTGTDAPVATVLKNTLGGEVVWTYDSVGQYNGTLTDAFPINKTNLTQDGDKCIFNRLIYNDGAGNDTRGFIIFRADDNMVVIKTTSEPEVFIDDILSSTFIEIRVYP